MGEGGERYSGVEWEEEKRKEEGRESGIGFRREKDTYTVYSTAYRDIIASNETPTPKCITQIAYSCRSIYAAYDGQATSQQVKPSIYRGACVLAA